MEFRTDSLRPIAEAFTKVIMQELKSDERYPIGEVETAMRSWLQAMGQMTLGMVLSQAEGMPERQLTCSCGGELDYQRRRAAQVRSVFDWVVYERAYYAGCECGQGQAPLDERFGLQPGQVTAGLAALLGQAGVQMGFEHSSQFLQPFLLFSVPPNTIRKETQGFGALQVEREAEWVAHSQEPEVLQARQRSSTRPKRIYGSLDGAYVRIERRDGSDQEPAQEKWREMKVGCFYSVEPVPERQQNRRQRQKTARGHPALRARNMHYFCDLVSADEWDPLFWAYACQARADLAQEVVFVCDGAQWIWNLIGRHFPQAIQIVDWFHAEERLEKVAQQVFSDPAQAAPWLEQTLTSLWHGEVSSVIQACQPFADQFSEAQQAVTYFHNNAQRMQYDQFRAQGYMLSSGTVESACKQIVSLRLKLPGAQWHLSGAVHTAKARAAWLSGEWDELRSRRDALPLAV